MAPAPGIQDLDVAILAGGLGTRLSGVLTDRPKILAPIENRPFLDYLFAWLTGQRVTRVVLCLGYRADAVKSYLDDNPSPGLRITVVVEPQPLGTAGAISHASSSLTSQPVMVINGDTFVDVCLSQFLQEHLDSGASASVVCARVENGKDYGRVELDSSGRISLFAEKDSSFVGPTWINAGIYLFNRSVLERIGEIKRGSLEHDVLRALPAGTINGYRSTGAFLDIGTPPALAKAHEIISAKVTLSQ